METEVWPNLVAACQANAVPLVLANARLNEKSWQSARRLSWLSRPAYAALHAVYAQGEADAVRLRDLGAPVQAVLGNLKFDARPNAGQLAQGQAWRALQDCPVVVLASAREGEEAALAQILKPFSLQALVKPEGVAIDSGASTTRQPVQWLVVPRHPQRFDAVAELLQSRGFSVSRRSSWGEHPEPADVWLGDSLARWRCTTA